MENQELASLNVAMKNFGVAFKELVEAVYSVFQRVAKFVQEILDRHKEADSKRQKFSLDLKRPFIASQVIDRKPKHMIRKIIH